MDDLHRTCPYRSMDAVGSLNCDCDGKAEAYRCYHPKIDGYVMLNKTRLKTRILDLYEGGTVELVTTLPPDCLTCKYRPVQADDNDIPPFRQQILTFAKALSRHVRGGMKKVKRDDYERRCKACLDCPSLTAEGRCTHCGCWISEKAMWATEACPERKWETVTTTRRPGIQSAIEAICSNCNETCDGPAMAECPKDLWPSDDRPRNRSGGCCP